MRCCQLCGARSWGPWKSATLSFKAEITESQIVLQCDGCGSVAREDLITDPVLDVIGAPGGFVPPYSPGAPFDPLGAAAQMMKGILPEKDPETRTERLVRAMLDIATIEDTTPRALVQFAVSIERELDKHNKPLPQLSAYTTQCPVPLRPRHFNTDFLLPTLKAIRCASDTQLVSEIVPLAFDCAIAYGALESLTGNESLSGAKLTELDAAYWDKVQRLSRWMA